MVEQGISRICDMRLQEVRCPIGIAVAAGCQKSAMFPMRSFRIIEMDGGDPQIAVDTVA